MIGSNPARIFPEKAPDPNCSVLARLFSLGRFGLQSAGFRQTLASQIPADSGQSEERTLR